MYESPLLGPFNAQGVPSVSHPMLFMSIRAGLEKMRSSNSKTRSLSGQGTFEDKEPSRARNLGQRLGSRPALPGVGRAVDHGVGDWERVD
jgi:hypothetical protein